MAQADSKNSITASADTSSRRAFLIVAAVAKLGNDVFIGLTTHGGPIAEVRSAQSFVLSQPMWLRCEVKLTSDLASDEAMYANANSSAHFLGDLRSQK